MIGANGGAAPNTTNGWRDPASAQKKGLVGSCTVSAEEAPVRLIFFGDSCRTAEANWGEPTQTPMGGRRKAKSIFTPILLRVLCRGLRRRLSGRAVASRRQLWLVRLEDQLKQRKPLRRATAAARSRGLGAKERAWREEKMEN